MRLTAAILAALGVLAMALPGVAGYVPGVDDGPPQTFTSIAEAEKAAGFDFPDAGVPPGWSVQVIVMPAYYGRRLLAERPELSQRRLSIREVVASGRLNTGELRYWLADGLPDTPHGVHNYINVVYRTENGVLISLDQSNPTYVAESRSAPISDAGEPTERTVRINGAKATLVTYTSPSSEALTVSWRVNHVPVQATAFNLTPNPSYRISADEFVSFLANVR